MVFKRSKKYWLYRFLVSHIFIVFIALGGNLTYENIPVIWSVTVIIPNVILSVVKNLSSVEIESEYVKLIFKKCFYKKQIESYRYSDLLFTYKMEWESRSKGMYFRIYKKGNEKSIISIGGIIDGFSEDEIERIITELNKKGIDVKTS